MVVSTFPLSNGQNVNINGHWKCRIASARKRMFVGYQNLIGAFLGEFQQNSGRWNLSEFRRESV